MNTRLLLALAGFLALVGVLLLTWPQGTDHPGPSSSSSSPAAAGTQGGTSPSRTADPGAGAPTGSATAEGAEPQAQKVAAGFAAAFAATGAQKAWLAGLKPYVTAELLDGFRYTDPHRRTTGHVEQITRRPASSSSSGSAASSSQTRFEITYTGGQQILCTVSQTPSGAWLVDSIEPVRAIAPSGADA